MLTNRPGDKLDIKHINGILAFIGCCVFKFKAKNSYNISLRYKCTSNIVYYFNNCRNGADQTKKNDRGETPYDLAVKGGYDSIVTKFASAMGSSQLKKMVKPKTTIPAS